MGVIRWEERYPGRWYGYLGKHGIADVIDFGTMVVWTLPDTLRNPDSDKLLGGNRSACVEAAKDAVEEFVSKWTADANLVSKAEFDEARQSGEHFIRELRASLETNKRRLDQIRDLQAENAVLRERIGSAFGDIDDAIAGLKRKVDDIVADTGVDRSYSWDVPVDEWWKGSKPKQRTEADFRNADIDVNGYVTFRDGGSA